MRTSYDDLCSNIINLQVCKTLVCTTGLLWLTGLLKRQIIRFMEREIEFNRNILLLVIKKSGKNENQLNINKILFENIQKFKRILVCVIHPWQVL